MDPGVDAVELQMDDMEVEAVGASPSRGMKSKFFTSLISGEILERLQALNIEAILEPAPPGETPPPLPGSTKAHMKECEEEEKAQYDFKNYVASATFTASLLDKAVLVSIVVDRYNPRVDNYTLQDVCVSIDRFLREEKHHLVYEVTVLDPATDRAQQAAAAAAEYKDGLLDGRQPSWSRNPRLQPGDRLELVVAKVAGSDSHPMPEPGTSAYNSSLIVEELAASSACKTINVVQSYAACVLQQPLNSGSTHEVRLVIGLFREITQGSLQGYLETLDPQRLYDRSAVKVAADYMEGLKELHANSFIHRHINPRNIYYVCSGDEIDPDNFDDSTWKVAALGTVRPQNALNTTVLNGPFGAPEMAGSAVYTPAVDCFAAGQLLYIMITGKELHLGPDGFTTAQQQALVEDLQQRTTFEVVEWYRKATDPQPDKRLDAAALLVKADELL